VQTLHSKNQSSKHGVTSEFTTIFTTSPHSKWIAKFGGLSKILLTKTHTCKMFEFPISTFLFEFYNNWMKFAQLIHFPSLIVEFSHSYSSSSSLSLPIKFKLQLLTIIVHTFCLSGMIICGFYFRENVYPIYKLCVHIGLQNILLGRVRFHTCDFPGGN
jgi:hypothetical protein